MLEQDQDAQNLAREFLDEEYRRNWAEDYLNTGLAMQIAVLREQRNMKQSDLAALAGTTQSAISRMEDVEYGAHSIRVLKQLAAAFGLRLRVSFEEFGTLVAESGSFSEQNLRRHSFQSDPEISRLLAAQGIPMPTVAVAPVTDSPADVPVEPPVLSPYSRFEDAFEKALFMPLEDRVKAFHKWLMGYGLPSAEEPAYKRLYFSIPPDQRHADWARRAAAACAEWLRPESFAELLSDPVDGQLAITNLLRLSATLHAGHKEIAAACAHLFPWLQDEWIRLDAGSQQAVIDLILELNEIELAKVVLAWPATARLTARQQIKISSHFLPENLDDLVVRTSLSDSLHTEAVLNRADYLVDETSKRVIGLINPQDAPANLEKRASERAIIAVTLLNDQEPVLQPV